jgi:deferrochelatase/peroxidase EfeB
MSQAKGVLPRADDRDVLYKNPRTCGYFVWVRLHPEIGRAEAEQWFSEVSGFVDKLVEHENGGKGDRVAVVAAGLAPSFFTRGGTPRFDPPIEPPAAFRPDPASPLPNAAAPLSSAARVDADVLFYVASTLESRVSRFIEQLWATRDAVSAISTERGYQRDNEREAFGYLDGLRNVVPVTERPETVFVHRDDIHIEEPAWADGGTYMAYMKILQNVDSFAALDSAAQDAVIGRNRGGDRLDLVDQHVPARKEPSEIGVGLVENAHVRKAGPRGQRDDCQIFRRGVPFIETSAEGNVRTGLQFCSFQASLDQFDVVLNDWMTNARFPGETSGMDALVDPARSLTNFEKVGFYFVPPHDESGLALRSVFRKPTARVPKSGRLVIRKRVSDPSDPTRRFERRGFQFTILDSSNGEIAHATTDSTGRAVVKANLTIGATYTVREDFAPVANVQMLPPQTFTMERSHQELRLVNQVVVPNTPYGA